MKKSNVEDGLHDQQAEDADGRPQQPLLAVDQRRVAVQAARVHVVEHHGHDQPHQRGDHHGPPQVGEVRWLKPVWKNGVDQVLWAEAACARAYASDATARVARRSRGRRYTRRPPRSGVSACRNRGMEEGVRALLSVANRDGIASLAKELQVLGVEIFATEGTRENLASDGIPVSAIEELTSAPPLVGGRVRTFHPQIYAGILARRNVPEDLAGARRAGHPAAGPGGRQRQARSRRRSAAASCRSTRPSR